MKKTLLFILALSALFSLSSCKEKRVHSEGNKTWLIVTDKDYQPFEYENENGFLEGIDIELLDAIAKDQNFAYKLESTGWNAGVSALKNGEADGLIAAATIRQSRVDSGWIFSDGYFLTSQTFAFFGNSTISSFSELKDKTIACKRNSMGQDFAESQKSKYGYTIKLYDNTELMLKDLLSQKVDGCCDDEAIIEYHIKHRGMNLYIPPKMKNQSSTYGFAIMNPENQELLNMFNAGLKNIRLNGKYQEILNKYL